MQFILAEIGIAYKREDFDRVLPLGGGDEICCRSGVETVGPKRLRPFWSMTCTNEPLPIDSPFISHLNFPNGMLIASITGANTTLSVLTSLLLNFLLRGKV